MDNDRFIPERAESEGSGFLPVATIKGKGNSSISQNYSYLDIVSGASPFYYRLKRVDLNGRSAYSADIATNGTLRAAQLRVYPNPAHQKMTIDLGRVNDYRKVNIKIISAAGQVLLEQTGQLSAGRVQISTSVLTVGSYQLLITGQGYRQTLPFQKN